MRPDPEPRPSWICRDPHERARFLDLHYRLLRVNSVILVVLVVAIAAALPYTADHVGLIPAGAGLVLFAAIQRLATRFARPELWVFVSLMGAETMIVLAVALNDGVLTPAMALLCWPVAGLAGRFPNRAARLGTLFAVLLAGGAVLATDPGVLTRDPLALTLLLVAIVSVHTVSTVLRDSDVEHRGAAVVDPLTGMLNRSALNNKVSEIEHQSLLTGEPVAVIVMDLDRFKLVNDNHGHATGDRVLQDFAYRLRKELRAYDLVYRLGGEEFVLLLLGASPHASLVTAEKICAAVAGGPMAGLDITISIGVAASAPGTAFVWDEVFARADAALYRAKAEGRNRVAADDLHGAELSAAAVA
jgi:diguanylate cyclase (GGDEF)-like protein